MYSIKSINRAVLTISTPSNSFHQLCTATWKEESLRDSRNLSSASRAIHVTWSLRLKRWSMLKDTSYSYQFPPIIWNMGLMFKGLIREAFYSWRVNSILLIITLKIIVLKMIRLQCESIPLFIIAKLIINSNRHKWVFACNPKKLCEVSKLVLDFQLWRRM